MELIHDVVNITETAASGKTQTLAEGDIIVPDIKPDILKLLQVDASSSITDKDVSDGAASFSGTVDLKVLYIPDSETERIKSIITSFDFNDRVENRNILPESTLFITSNVERVEFSLKNSRKLNIKAVVASEYEIINTEEKELTAKIEDCESMETQNETITLQSCADLSEHTFTVQDSIEIPSGRESVKELLKLDASVSDCEYKALSKKVIIKGEINVSALYNDAAGNAEYCEAQIPFTEVLEGDGITEKCICDIDYSLREGEITVCEDSDGDARIINAAFEVTAQLRAFQTHETEMIKDCFLPFSQLRTEKESMTLEEVISRPCLQATIRETIETGSKQPSISEVYNVITKPVIKKAQPDGNKILCEGFIEACVLYLSDSVENPVYSIKKEIPFSLMMDAQATASGAQITVKPEIKHTSYSLNAAGDAEVRCILLLCANVLKSREIETIVSLEEVAADAPRKSGMVIYFIQPGDTLWSIAKHYAVPPKSILDFNDIKGENFKTGARLLIPGK